MPKIMKQRRQANEALVLIRELEHIAEQPCYVEDPKRVVEPSVESAGVHHVRHCKLPNASKSLKRWSFNDFSFVARQTNEAMYRISYSSLFAHGSKHFCKSSFEQYTRFPCGEQIANLRG
jgi:hypothetical protein